MSFSANEEQLNITTKRLMLYPLSNSEIQNMIDTCSDEKLATAYSCMLDSCRAHPNLHEWFAPWAIELKSEKAQIGTLGFRGPANDSRIEIGYGINKEYEGHGYTYEAAEALINWAFNNENILFVEAEADENNTASIHILEKLGFKKCGYGKEGPRFVKAKPDMPHISIGTCLDLCLGLALGILIFDNRILGMGLGLAIGLCFSSAKK